MNCIKALEIYLRIAYAELGAISLCPYRCSNEIILPKSLLREYEEADYRGIKAGRKVEGVIGTTIGELV